MGSTEKKSTGQDWDSLQRASDDMTSSAQGTTEEMIDWKGGAYTYKVTASNILIRRRRITD